METKAKGSHLFLGVTLFTQAVTSLVGGIVFLNPFNTQTIGDAFMRMVAGSTAAAYASIVLQAVTAVVIILLGASLYRAAGHRNKAAATAALGLYTAEAILLLVGQAFVFGILEAARLYSQNGDPQLIALTNVLYACRQFSGGIAMLPFGIGALIFYCQITGEGILPKWLGWYGIVTVIPILLGVPLGTFGVDVPFPLLAPYVPFEFVAGAYLIVKSLKKRSITA